MAIKRDSLEVFYLTWNYFLKKTGFSILEKVEYKKHSHFYTVEKTNNKEEAILDNRYKHYKEMFNEYIIYHKNLVDQINKHLIGAVQHLIKKVKSIGIDAIACQTSCSTVVESFPPLYPMIQGRSSAV